MIRELVLKNRSYRRFDSEESVTESTLLELVDLARLSPSGANRQPLKYFLSTKPEFKPCPRSGGKVCRASPRMQATAPPLITIVAFPAHRGRGNTEPSVSHQARADSGPVVHGHSAVENHRPVGDKVVMVFEPDTGDRMEIVR